MSLYKAIIRDFTPNQHSLWLGISPLFISTFCFVAGPWQSSESFPRERLKYEIKWTRRRPFSLACRQPSAWCLHLHKLFITTLSTPMLKLADNSTSNVSSTHGNCCGISDREIKPKRTSYQAYPRGKSSTNQGFGLKWHILSDKASMHQKLKSSCGIFMLQS